MKPRAYTIGLLLLTVMMAPLNQASEESGDASNEGAAPSEAFADCGDNGLPVQVGCYYEYDPICAPPGGCTQIRYCEVWVNEPEGFCLSQAIRDLIESEPSSTSSSAAAPAMESAMTFNEGPGGDCSGQADAMCYDPDDGYYCPPGSVCVARDYCVLYARGECVIMGDGWTTFLYQEIQDLLDG